jgi:hypothetical protein
MCEHDLIATVGRAPWPLVDRLAIRRICKEGEMPFPAPRWLPIVRALPRRDGSLDRVTPLDPFVEVSDVDEGRVTASGHASPKVSPAARRSMRARGERRR